MRIGSVPAFFSPIFLNRALIEMCFYDSYPVFWEHSDLENPLQHQTSTTLLWLLRENPSTLPLSCSRCCVSTSTPKPRAEGSSPSAPAKTRVPRSCENRMVWGFFVLKLVWIRSSFPGLCCIRCRPLASVRTRFLPLSSPPAPKTHPTSAVFA